MRLVAGQTASAGVGFALSQAPDRMSASTAQALNLLANDLVLTSAVGFLVIGLIAGLAVLRGDTAPAWIGWFSIAIGALFVIPPIEFFGFLLLLVWTLITSVLLVRQRQSPHVTALQPEPALTDQTVSARALSPWTGRSASSDSMRLRTGPRTVRTSTPSRRPTPISSA